MCRKCPNQTYIVKYNKKRHKTLSPIYSISPKRSPISSAHRYSEPNFNKIGRLFTEIWRFNDFQNGGRPTSWILKNCSFCHVALVDMPFCFFIQNVAEIGQLVDELWPKKRFSKWRPSAILDFKNLQFLLSSPCRHAILLPHTKFC